MKNLLFALLGIIAVAIAAPAHADVTLSPMFSDSAVLQRETAVPVWGWDNPGQQVTVTLDGQTKSATADAQGHWLVRLDSMKAGGPHIMTVKGSSTLERKDILIGEVWLCSGQSNMAWTMSGTTHYKEALTTADQPRIRMITIPSGTSSVALEPSRRQWIDPTPALPTYGVSPGPGLPDPNPMKTPPFAWQVATPKSIYAFSGVAYNFGYNLHADLDVPIGLVTSAWGGTIIEAWISKPAIQANPLSERIFKRQAENEKGYALTIDNYRKYLIKQAEQDKARAATQPNAKPSNPPKRPGTPAGPNAPAVLYNAMIFPVAPYAIRGALWYQGESNSARPAEYASLLSSLIKDWRSTWNQGDFPFLVVQLPNHSARSWPLMRQAQVQAVQSVPNADYAVTIDVGSTVDIHPKDKKSVGARLALLALKNVYGKKIVAHGPTFASVKFENEKAVVTFENIGSGLVTKDAKPPALFELAGPDGKFAPAAATIAGDSITLTCSTIKAPTCVRFAWSDTAPGFNLYNKEGLPAAPFTFIPETKPTAPVGR